MFGLDMRVKRRVGQVLLLAVAAFVIAAEIVVLGPALARDLAADTVGRVSSLRLRSGLLPGLLVL